ncbi:response regulator [Desulfosarcina ovata]|uniref:Response regulatory domain-containing protein n=1 Tax=Desulfosarcina ovata subsp. ovata TaxID=2752305 RepID=A0A5K8AC33_9BACT|nr:response regulator [Desulfosarcina ovata]BBO90177.1 hypothetical protein DSCOOX_33570 [Desulfosarcina ovata subsp. ovata]
MPTLTDSKILVVEDDPEMCESIRYLLGYYGFEVNTSQNLVDALNTLLAIDYDLVLLDLKLGDQSGFAVMDHLQERALDTQVIVVTGCHAADDAITALKKGATDYLKKPFEADDLLNSVNRVLDRQKHQRELSLFKRVVAASPEAIVIGDHQGRVIYTNVAYHRLMNPRQPVPASAESGDAAPFFDREIKTVLDTGLPWQGKVEMTDATGHPFTAWKRVETVPYTIGGLNYGVALLHDMTPQLELEANQEKFRNLVERTSDWIWEVEKLKNALARVKHLSGMLPICAACKRIRDDNGYWTEIEAYIETHSDAEFSHGICPDCARKLYPELYPE